ERAAAVQELQDGVVWERHRALIGTEHDVLVDGRSEDPAFTWEGRTAGQAPEIDGIVYLRGPFEPGRFARIRVVEVEGYELVGEWAAHRAEALLGGKDPGAIVVDEVAGMTLSVLALPLTPAVLAVAFVLFRVFDVVKPPPARGSQSLRGGVGVMVDDLIAGLYALAVVGVLRGVFRWP